MQGRLYPRSDDERQKAIEAGYDVSALLFQDDLCKGEQVRGMVTRCECLMRIVRSSTPLYQLVGPLGRNSIYLSKTAVWHVLAADSY